MTTQKPINAWDALTQLVCLLGGMWLFMYIMTYLFTGEGLVAWW